MINFKEHDAPSSPLFYYSKIIIKVADEVKIENCLFRKKYNNNKLPSIFNNWFTFSSKCLTIIKHRLPLKEIFKSLVSKQHMEKMLLFSVIRTWNDIQKEMKGVMLNTFSLAKLKSLLIEFYLNMYKTS